MLDYVRINKWLGAICSIFFAVVTMAANNGNSIHTYMAFGLPLDPANVKTLVDLDLSYALASTLTEWSESHELVSGIAKSWEVTKENEIVFKFRDGLQWSDGTPVTANQMVLSLNRAKKVHNDSLRSLFDLVKEISAVNGNHIKFILTTDVKKSGILSKLTEPMYGLVFIKNNDELDLSKTVGPFTLAKFSNEEIQLKQNPKWHRYIANMPESVVIRRPPVGEEIQDSFVKDEWVNLMTSSSLVEQSVHETFQKRKYAIWNRSLDKIFFLSPGPRISNGDGLELFKFLNRNLDRSILTSGMSGFNLSQQFFPSGYVLFDPDFKPSSANVSLPKIFKSRPIKVLGVSTRLSLRLRENIKAAIKKAVGIEPEFKLVQLSEFETARSGLDYDFLAGALPVNDPNVEGAMGFFFGMKPPIIPDAGAKGLSFSERVKKAKILSEQSARNAEYRRIFSDATIHGSVVPLFHYSTVVIAKSGMDLSSVPMSDETVSFSKVRFK